jgi:hypothetical protein
MINEEQKVQEILASIESITYCLRLPRTGPHSTLFVRAPAVKIPVDHSDLSRHSNCFHLCTEYLTLALLKT